MSPRRRRNYYLSPYYDGRKYVKKVKIHPRQPNRPEVNVVSKNENPKCSFHKPDHCDCPLPKTQTSSSEEQTVEESPTPPQCPEPAATSSGVMNVSAVISCIPGDSTETKVASSGLWHNENSPCASPESVQDDSDHFPGEPDPNQEESLWEEFLKIFPGKNTKEKFEVRSNILTIEVLYMILNYYIRHNLTQQALEDLLRMINTISGTKFVPESFQAFTSLFETKSSERIYFCMKCQYDFGVKQPESTTICPCCGSNEYDFFLSMPIEPQLRETCEKYESEIEQYAQTIENDELADINRGQIARNLIQNNPGKHLTLSINTDGAAAFKSTTRKPLYPIFCVVNNLPPVIRFQKSNLIVAGLWLSRGEPNPNLLFKYVCLELRKFQEGILIGDKLYKVHLLQNCLDSVARCKVQCNKQFNGEYGCTLCLHPGETRSSKNGRCYPNKPVEMRDNISTRKIMNEVNSGGQEMYGVMGKSVFTYLAKFDVIAGYPVDYMHAVNLGAVKQILALLTGTENHRQEYYVGRQMQAINERIQSFKLPSCFPRKLRTLDEQKQFKANEWEALLLYFIYPCLYGILEESFLNHIMELSSVIFLLLDPRLSPTTIDDCERRIEDFVKLFEAYYGKDSMTYNIHLLTHLGFSARNTGALYNSSLYPYESGNGMLLKFRSGNNKPILQIERKYRLNRLVHLARVPKTSLMHPWIRSLWTTTNSTVEYNTHKLFVSNFNVTYEKGITETDFSTLDKIFFKGISFCTKSVCKTYQYDDSWVYKNGVFYSIQHILSDKQNHPYFVGQVLVVEQVFTNMYKYFESEEYSIVKIDSSVRQCVSMVIRQEKVVCRFIAKCKVLTQAD